MCGKFKVSVVFRFDRVSRTNTLTDFRANIEIPTASSVLVSFIEPKKKGNIGSHITSHSILILNFNANIFEW